MKVPFKQETKSGCGYYCLANLLNDERYLRDVADLERGQGVAQLNRRLAEYDKELFLETVFAAPSEMKSQPAKLIDPLVFMIIWDKLLPEHKEDFIRPFIISVRMLTGRFHAILVLHDFKLDQYHVVDSLCQEVKTMSLGRLMSDYWITTVEYFCRWDIDNEDPSILINKSVLNHLITNDNESNLFT